MYTARRGHRFYYSIPFLDYLTLPCVRIKLPGPDGAAGSTHSPYAQVVPVDYNSGPAMDEINISDTRFAGVKERETRAYIYAGRLYDNVQHIKYILQILVSRCL